MHLIQNLPQGLCTFNNLAYRKVLAKGRNSVGTRKLRIVDILLTDSFIPPGSMIYYSDVANIKQHQNIETSLRSYFMKAGLFLQWFTQKHSGRTSSRVYSFDKRFSIRLETTLKSTVCADTTMGQKIILNFYYKQCISLRGKATIHLHCTYASDNLTVMQNC